MPEQPQFVPAAGAPPGEDELRLPRAPGVIRRFWARHPLLADVLIAVAAFLIAVPSVAVRSPLTAPVSGWWIAAGLILSIVGCGALVWRRRRPVAVLAVSLLPTLAVEPMLAAALSGPAAVVALYSVAVYRSVRSCWIAFGVASTALAVNGLARILIDPSLLSVQLNVVVSSIVGLLLGALVGVNVGNRRRYLMALIDRSRQLLVERDQQAQIAAAAERTRIAREMHDIVSHSLTVVVALADGATTTKDPERAADATRAIAQTAREALAEMRVMLGVLRDDDPVPLAPLGDATVQDAVATARAAGATVTLRETGDRAATATSRLALLRIVQEGITNALRYARPPADIRIEIDHRDDGIDVSIENDGAVPDAPSQGAGLGLRGLQERVAHVGGTMDAGFRAPGVWRLHAVIPASEGPA
ncbi:sensor histidine kinase [Microbacterium sp.]|uniref:sensor histidine kinase n=1 Tax=Microbacterium sp. TaxID=51671 RepID=UPI003F72EFEE